MMQQVVNYKLGCENMTKHIMLIIIVLMLLIIFFKNSSKKKQVKKAEKNLDKEDQINFQKLEENLEIKTDHLDIDYKEKYEFEQEPTLKEAIYAVEITKVLESKDDIVILKGYVESEKIKIKEKEDIEIVGFSELVIKGKILKIKNTNDELIQEASTGEEIKLFVTDLKEKNIEVGQVLTSPGYIIARKEIESLISIEGDENSQYRLNNGSEIVLRFGERNIRTKIIFQEELDSMKVGETQKAKLHVNTPIAVIPDMEFFIELSGEKKVAINIKMV